MGVVVLGSHTGSLVIVDLVKTAYGSRESEGGNGDKGGASGSGRGRKGKGIYTLGFDYRDGVHGVPKPGLGGGEMGRRDGEEKTINTRGP